MCLNQGFLHFWNTQAVGGGDLTGGSFSFICQVDTSVSSLSLYPSLSLFLSPALCLSLSLSPLSLPLFFCSPYNQPILSRCDQHTWHRWSKCSLASLSFSQREAKRTGQRDPEGVGADFLPIWFKTGGSRWGLKMDFNVNLGHIG